MTKTMKKTTVFAAFAAATLLAAGIGLTNPVNAWAENETESTTETITVVEGVASAGFTMTNGASLKAVDNEVGIRWQTTVSDSFKKYIADNYAGATVAYKTLVTGVNMLPAGGDVTDVTPDLKKPNGTDAACAVLDGTLAEDGTFEGRIVYSAEDPAKFEEIKDAAVRAELIARSYVEITTSTGTEIIYAQATDTARAMQGVAVKALDGTNANDKTIAQQYVKSIDYLKDEQAQIPYYHYAEGDKQNTMEVAGLADGTYNAYAYAAKVGTVTVANGVVSGITKMGAAQGKTEHPMYFVNAADQAFTVDFINPTAILTKAADFDMFNLNTPFDAYTETYAYGDGVNAYYVLGNDIDATDHKTLNREKLTLNINAHTTEASIKSNGKIQWLRESGLRGTFDGRGHTVSNLTTQGGGIFGIIGQGGTVKNVAFTNVTIANGTSSCPGSLFAKYTFDAATLENLYIQVKSITGSGDTHAVLSYMLNHRATLNNVVINTGTSTGSKGSMLANKSARHDIDAYSNYGTAGTPVEVNWSNTYVVSQYQKGLCPGISGLCAANETPTSTSRYAAGLYKYATVEDWKAAQTSEETKNNFSSFSSTFWTIVDGVPTWGGSADS